MRMVSPDCIHENRYFQAARQGFPTSRPYLGG